MTGFGRGRAKAAATEVWVEARAVNARFLDVRVRLPARLLDHTARLEEIARRSLTRGRVELSGRLEGGSAGPVVLDAPRAREAFEALRDLRDELAPDEPLPLGLLSAVPELFTDMVPGDTRQALGEALSAAAEQACVELSSMRKREGAALASDLKSRLVRISELTDTIEPRAGIVVDEYRAKLANRVARLLSGSELSPDPARLELEVALLADRADVSEELTRLRAHIEHFGELLAMDDDPVGRKLEFLLQEMGREVNTIGSKVGDVAVTRSVLDLKAELERMREQVQNVL